MTKKSSGIIGGLIGGAICLVVGGVFFFALGRPAVQQGKESLQWPKTTATILSSKVITSKGKKNKTMYAPEISYKYEVEGTSYESNNIQFGLSGSSSSSSSAHHWVQKYPKGKEISIHYNPKTPGMAVIETGTHWLGRLLWWIGLGVMILGVVILVSSLAKILIGILVIGGAVTGAIGKSPSNPGGDRFAPEGLRQPISRDPLDFDSDRHDDDDDGINIH